MISRHIDKAKRVRLLVNKLLTVISTMLFFCLCASATLWKASIYSPDLKIYAFLFGGVCAAFYSAALVNLQRLRNEVTDASPVDSEGT